MTTLIAEHPLLAAALAAPLTHCVVTRYEGGAAKYFPTRSVASAESFAIGERRKIGRDLISRNADMTAGPIVRVASVEVEELALTIARQFVLNLTNEMSAEEFIEAHRLNRTPAYSGGCCASHNYCDANMPMAEAFELIMGREFAFDGPNAQKDTDLFNAAWARARAEGIL